MGNAPFGWLAVFVDVLATVSAVIIGGVVTASAQTTTGTPSPSPQPVSVVQIGSYDATDAVDVFRVAVVVGFAMVISLLAVIAVRGVRSR